MIGSSVTYNAWQKYTRVVMCVLDVGLWQHYTRVVSAKVMHPDGNLERRNWRTQRSMNLVTLMFPRLACCASLPPSSSSLLLVIVAYWNAQHVFHSPADMGPHSGQLLVSPIPQIDRLRQLHLHGLSQSTLNWRRSNMIDMSRMLQWKDDYGEPMLGMSKHVFLVRCDPDTRSHNIC